MYLGLFLYVRATYRDRLLLIGRKTLRTSELQNVTKIGLVFARFTLVEGPSGMSGNLAYAVLFSPVRESSQPLDTPNVDNINFH